MLFLIVLLFPHQLLLLPAFFLLLCFCYQISCISRAPEGCIWPIYTGRKKQLISLLLILLWILFITVMGCFLECYVNPLLVADGVKLLL
ncbi:MAG: stage II sporulation protein M [Lachnospiraceae bacterium]